MRGKNNTSSISLWYVVVFFPMYSRSDLYLHHLFKHSCERDIEETDFSYYFKTQTFI